MPNRLFVRARPAFAAALLCLSLAAPAAADPAQEAQIIVDAARVTLANFMADPNMAGFRELLPEVRGLLIIPEENKGGFILAGSGGAGVLVALDDLHDGWSPPAFYRTGSASVGFQIGGARSEVILLFMTQRAVDAMLATSTRLGGELSVAAGPVGKGSGEVGADIVSYARSKGLFAGISMEGSVIKPTDSRNRGFYGRTISPLEILVRREVGPGAAQPLIDDVSRATGR